MDCLDTVHQGFLSEMTVVSSGSLGPFSHQWPGLKHYLENGRQQPNVPLCGTLDMTQCMDYAGIGAGPIPGTLLTTFEARTQ